MNVKKQNTLIEISELGFKVEIKADLLLNALISDTTKISLEKMLIDRLDFLLEQFKIIHSVCQEDQGYINYKSYKENRDMFIYEYACLIRDLYSLLGDTFDIFYENNSEVMETIGSIFRYSDLYGFKSLKEVNL